jgi:hypothetical protein
MRFVQDDAVKFHVKDDWGSLGLFGKWPILLFRPLLFLLLTKVTGNGIEGCNEDINHAGMSSRKDFVALGS